ncbi:MAG: adenosylcobinamide-GDP ribazoletransferase [Gammaproteobacteria bacterium]|nr:adenosylcobinamide-GDP ribazoletransferase [Gammaproteobacteria bacterium]
MAQWHALLIALQFLTRLPVPFRIDYQPRHIGHSLLYYPLVGLLIGGLLWLSALLLQQSALDNSISAALILSLWVLLTGGLHLDGLADSADAWVGGLRDRQRTLEIMKDPSCGPIGVLSLLLVLLLKFAALQSVLAQNLWQALLLAPLLARAALPLLLLTTPYVREQGLGSALKSHLPRPALIVMLILLGSAMVIWVNGWLLLSLIMLFYLLRQVMLKRLGGTTGDTAGAMVEILEVAVLLTLLS